MNKVPLSPKWHRALELLAKVGENGFAEAVLIARGFPAEMLKSLVRTGLATDLSRISGQAAPFVRITSAGLRAIEG
jgi:hypothetical protein